VTDETRAHYAGLELIRTFELLRRFCADRGADELAEDSGYNQLWIDRERGVAVFAQWDPDHERIYAELRATDPPPSPGTARSP
jgi:hypothetical protein